MKRTRLLQELRQMKFESIYEDWKEKKLTQVEAARLLDVSDRTFRRYIDKYEDDGIAGLMDQRIESASHRCAPADEVCRLEDQYREGFVGWNVKHFYSWYQRDGGTHQWVPEKYWDLIVTMDEETRVLTIIPLIQWQ